MKRILILVSLLLVAQFSSARTVVNLTSGGTLNNKLHSESNTSSFADTTGQGYSKSVGTASSHAVNTGSFTARACPKQGHTVGKTTVWGGSHTYGSNVSNGGGNGSVASNAYSDGTSTVKAWEQGRVSVWRPGFDQSWTGKSDIKASSKFDTGSAVSIGKNSKGNAYTSVDGESNAKSSWKVSTNRFGMSDTKKTETSSKTLTYATSWKQGANVYYVGGGSNGSNEETADASVVGRTRTTGNVD